MGGSEWLYLLLGILLVRCAWSADQETITAESGQDVNLTCRAPNNNFELVEWSRADLSDTFVFVLKNKTPNYDDQDPSFKNRVALQDKEMKDGNVSVILYNVTAADNGTYECRVPLDKTHSSNPISIITLSVDPPGQPGGHTEDGSVGLRVGLSVTGVLLLVAAVCFLIRKLKQCNQAGFIRASS
ncbi:cell surface A33 antigen [Oreochromis niloticus]|uniref:cell surface A33 antigen n=1 Tax=Oreochromis niloticus TaxID=8128 RepID=UPI000905AFF1|nr:cell surface A33 antigen [Oreochromis niloticus]